MTYLKLFCLFSCCIFSCFSKELSIDYEIMDQNTFQKVVVGNTILGTTRQSHSLYMLYFLPDGYCKLWKQNEIYDGNWWIEKDELNRDFVRAFWPEYTSSESKSLFSPDNPRYGTATSLRYYLNVENGAIFLAGKNFLSPVILARGYAFPTSFSSEKSML